MTAVEQLKIFSNETQISYFCKFNANICRICLNCEQNKKMSNIFDGSEPLSNMIMSCAVIQILQNDGLPNLICQKCITMLNVAYQFKLQCESSDLKLRQIYLNANEKRGNSTIVNCEELKKANELDGVHEEDSGFVQNNDFPNDETEVSSDEKAKPARNSKDNKIHQCETCGKIFHRREYLTQHIRIHTGEKPYCCHICDKRFINSGHLTTHMRTHTGEKPHACSQCPKAFSTKQELNKHTMVHNGERPFICSTCGKCFGSSSNLYSHLRHHTGEKNFTCEHCGKAFYTKQELKQHFVVHTGEKAFACEICNKRFSQRAHLQRHSKLHA